jgi:hypothetical protein
MYQAIQINRLITAVGVLAVLIFIAILWYAGSDSALQSLKQVTTAASITGVVILLIGNKWVFCPLWRLDPIQSFLFPYIAGEWEGQVSSNWPVVTAMSSAFIDGSEAHPSGDRDIEVLGTADKPIKVTIEADLFHIRMSLQTTDDYSTSQTIFVTPRRSLGVAELVYIYQNDTPVPVNTDALNHLGAAYLKIAFRDGERVMEGTYWTARNWTKGLNTAGRIVLHRPRAQAGMRAKCPEN